MQINERWAAEGHPSAEARSAAGAGHSDWCLREARDSGERVSSGQGQTPGHRGLGGGRVGGPERL